MEEEKKEHPNRKALIKLRCSNCRAENRFLFDNNLQYCSNCRTTLFDIKIIGGYVYVLSNQSIPNLFKIGFTQNSVEQRVIELNSSTSIPEKFEIELIFACEDPRYIESLIHNELNEYRYNDKREFFGTTFWKVYLVLKSITNDEPIFSNLNEISEKSLEGYNPWHKPEKSELKSATNELKSATDLKHLICPICKNTTRKHHQNMDRRASFYCKRCKTSYNSAGLKL
jgi:protein-arginine kinase activator protein McsA